MNEGRICGESLWLIFPLLIVLVRALLKFPVLIHWSLLPFHDLHFSWPTCGPDFTTQFVALIGESFSPFFYAGPLPSPVKPTSFHIWFTSSLKMEAAALFINFFWNLCQTWSCECRDYEYHGFLGCDRTLPHQLLFVLFGCYLCCSMYCLCVNVYSHWVTTQLQLINMSYHYISMEVCWHCRGTWYHHLQSSDYSSYQGRMWEQVPLKC